MTTNRQKAAVHFCEDVLCNIKYEGDLEDFKSVSNFLSEHLDDAKRMFDEIKCEYDAYMHDLMYD